MGEKYRIGGLLVLSVGRGPWGEECWAQALVVATHDRVGAFARTPGSPYSRAGGIPSTPGPGGPGVHRPEGTRAPMRPWVADGGRGGTGGPGVRENAPREGGAGLSNVTGRPSPVALRPTAHALRPPLCGGDIGQAQPDDLLQHRRDRAAGPVAAPLRDGRREQLRGDRQRLERHAQARRRGCARAADPSARARSGSRACSRRSGPGSGWCRAGGRGRSCWPGAPRGSCAGPARPCRPGPSPQRWRPASSARAGCGRSSA